MESYLIACIGAVKADLEKTLVYIKPTLKFGTYVDNVYTCVKLHFQVHTA